MDVLSRTCTLSANLTVPVSSRIVGSCKNRVSLRCIDSRRRVRDPRPLYRTPHRPLLQSPFCKLSVRRFGITTTALPTLGKREWSRREREWSSCQRSNSAGTTVCYRNRSSRVLVLCLHGETAVRCLRFEYFCIRFDSLGRLLQLSGI